MRYDEVAAGYINHAIRFTSETINRSYIWPARHSDGGVQQQRMPRRWACACGSRPAPTSAAIDPSVRVVLQALKDYGMILADTGTSLDIGGVPDSRWNDNVMHTLEQFHGSDFEAVDELSLMIDPNSGQSR